MHPAFSNVTALSSSRQRHLQILRAVPCLLPYGPFCCSPLILGRWLWQVVLPFLFSPLCLFLGPAVGESSVKLGPGSCSGYGTMDLSRGELAWLSLELLV